MGNEASNFVKVRRTSKESLKDVKIFGDCKENRYKNFLYRKYSNFRRFSDSIFSKARRSVSHSRLSNGVTRNSPPSKKGVPDSVVSSRKSSASNIRSGLPSDGSGDSFLAPPSISSDRRRSRSLCSTQMKDDVQSVAGQIEETVYGSKPHSRKSSSGLVPSLNRLRIQQCYKAAKPQIGEAILKRAATTRPEMRSFLSRMNEQQVESVGRQMYEVITIAVDNMDKNEKVLVHARQMGETYAGLCPLGFRPDLFAPLADAAIAECVKLDSGMHKSRCDILSAWSQLIGSIFTGIRDGYYMRVRYQRRSSLPQTVVSKQLSVDLTKCSDSSSVSRVKFE
ncbi:hypothetical protein WR25_08547 isoform C [Diploscapter pachys]|uniref:Globin domain-containing protein n=1 Tax=Diploscapter pachys TaxID=2018661 RepID=A0A2A2L5U8_9BILA|nr:hypothetical protein WR25_08547 isoform C [Diploscapter pachys]